MRQQLLRTRIPASSDEIIDVLSHATSSHHSSSDSVSVEESCSDEGDGILFDPSTPSNCNYWDEKLIQLQQTANIISHLLAFLSVFMVTAWINNMGGLSWKHGESKMVFNWHPLLMIAAFSFMTVASLSFRFPYKCTNRIITKCLHGIAWTVASVCALFALIAVFRSHNDPVSGYVANMYSLHSWAGIIVIILYFSQFVIGFFTFGSTLPYITSGNKNKIMLIHQFISVCVYNCTAATIMMGIQEKEGFVGCAYAVSEADLVPNPNNMPTSCKISHALGIIVFFLAIFTSFALHDFRKAGVGA